MAGMVHKPLAIFRKTDSSKPLHSRWGDVAISVPTDGSWNQYDNPHKRVPTRQRYGPGFVANCSPTDGAPPRQHNEYKHEKRKHSKMGTTSMVQGDSISLGVLCRERHSLRLTSRPKPSERVHLARVDYPQPERKARGFAYKPIRQDYPAEVTEKSQANANRFRYIPTSGRYLQDNPATTARSQSQGSYRNTQTGGNFAASLEGNEGGREQPRFKSQPCRSQQEDDCHNLRSSFGDNFGSSSTRRNHGLPPRRRTSPTLATKDRKRASSLKPMTLAMVPDPEELYE